MPTWRITYDGTGQAVGDRLDETLYVASGDDTLPAGWSTTENTGAGGLLKIDSSFPSEGTRGIRFETTAATSCYVTMLEDATWGTTRWIATDLYIPSTAILGANWDVFQPREAATLFRCRVTTARNIAVVLGSTVQATGTTVLSFDTLYRLTFRMVYSTTVGVLEAKIYLGNSTSPLETITSSGINTGTVLATNVRFGMPFPITIGASGPVYLDNTRGSDVSEPGPSGATGGISTGNPGKVKRWNGSAWVTNNNVKRWTGTVWESADIHPYD